MMASDSALSLDRWLADAAGTAYSPRGQTALWQQIYSRIRDGIETGALPPGARLPGEVHMAQAFHVTRVTLRRSLRQLQDEGLLEARKGVGIFVRRPSQTYAISSGRRFSDAIDADESRISTRTLRLDRTGIDPEAASALKIRADRKAIMLHRVRLLDGDPVYLTKKVFPASRLPRFEAVYRDTASVSAVFAQHGIPRYYTEEMRVSGGFATDDEAESLHLTPNTPVIRTWAVNCDPDGTPIEYNIGCWPLEMVELRFRPS